MDTQYRNRKGKTGLNYGDFRPVRQKTSKDAATPLWSKYPKERDYVPGMPDQSRPARGTDRRRGGADAFSGYLLFQTIAAAAVLVIMTAIRLISSTFYETIETGVNSSFVGKQDIGTLSEQVLGYIKTNETFARLFSPEQEEDGKESEPAPTAARTGAEGDAAIFFSILEKGGDGTISVIEPTQQHQGEGVVVQNILTYRPETPETVVAPVAGGELTSDFGVRDDPFNADTGDKNFHYGLDIAVVEGTRVVSVMGGTVRLCGQDDISGKYIIVTHSDGFESYYGHLDRFSVKEGDSVKTGQVIALSGDTGRTTGPHLHFSLLKDEQFINPRLYFDV